MKIINNKRGSALLWCILLLVILTILLGAINSAMYAYFNYTMYAVKREQAYLTARSAISVILDKISEQSVEEVDGSTVEKDSELIPAEGKTIEITSFDFPTEMGTAKAWISRGDVKDAETESLSGTEAQDYVTIKVVATYADQTYTLNATAANAPMYFSGVAIKDIKKQDGSTKTAALNLESGTDLYYNSTNTFDTRNLSYDLTIGGNLVTKGNAIIKKGMTINGEVLSDTKDVELSIRNNAAGKKDYSFSRKIWNAEQYAISNKTLNYYENNNNTEYNSSTFKTIQSFVNNTNTYARCKNRDYSFSYLTLSGWKTYNSLNYFGGSSILSNAITGLGSMISDDMVTDLATDGLSVTDSNNESLTVQYIKVLSNQKLFGNLAANILDISYIGFESTDKNAKSDAIVPLTYLLVPDSSHSVLSGESAPDRGLVVRIMFGSKPGKLVGFNAWLEEAGNTIQSVSDFIMNRTRTPAYTIVYLGSDATLELGIDEDVTLGGLGGEKAINQYPNAKSDGSLVFLYTIYGEPGSKVILHDGVVVVGQINVDTIELDGSATVVYSTSNGSKVAKQKVGNIWTVTKYFD